MVAMKLPPRFTALWMPEAKEHWFAPAAVEGCGKMAPARTSGAPVSMGGVTRLLKSSTLHTAAEGCTFLGVNQTLVN